MALGPVAASPSAAVDPVESVPALHNASTHAGAPIAPRYLTDVGDLDVSLLGSFIRYPGIRASLLGSELALQVRLSDALHVMANLGHAAEIGLRGPLIEASAFRLGWDAHYRSDWYFLTASGFGLGAPAYGVIPVPGGSAHGMEVSLNAMQSWRQWSFYLTPSVSVMSNRSLAGFEAGVDWTIGPLGLGYAFGHQQMVHNPDLGASSLVPAEQLHRLGARWAWSKDAYVHLHAKVTPQDTYGIPVQGLMAGVGWTFSLAPGTPPRVSPPVALAPEPPRVISEPDVVTASEEAPTSEPVLVTAPPPESRVAPTVDPVPEPRLEPPIRQAVAWPPVLRPEPSQPPAAEGLDETPEARVFPAQDTGPFGLAAPRGPFTADSMIPLESLDERSEDPGRALFSISAASGVLSAAQESANGAAAAVAIVVCCLLLLGTGERSEDETLREER